MAEITIIVLLLFGVVFLRILSNRLRFALPIALVLGGVAISLIPGLPVIELRPDVVFLMFLPPLLYEAAWKTGWREFRSNIKPISTAAIGLVIITTVVVGAAAYYLIPDIGWPTAFLIGAIVSPPDAIAATAITKGLGLHPRIVSILEGESLVNDASGLVAYKYALVAATVGNFVFWKAGLNFVVIALAGIGVGLAIGFLMMKVHRRFAGDPIMEASFSLLTPFASYLFAEHFHFSGVLAVVTTGLFLSFRSSEIFSHQGRITAYAVWEVAGFVLNGLVFVLIGLQLRQVLAGISDYPVGTLLLYGLGISLVVILVRFLFAYPAVYLPRLISRRLRAHPFDARNVVVFGWAGMRGVVSMAAALALPLTLPDGSPFPHRNLILYITFSVILFTLVLLGLSLPWVIRRMKMPPFSVAAEEYTVRTQLMTRMITHIEENLSLMQDDVLHNIKSKYEVKYNRLQKTDLPANYFANGRLVNGNIFNEYTQLQIDLINVERTSLRQMHLAGESSEAVVRKLEHELDLEETRLKMEIYN